MRNLMMTSALVLPLLAVPAFSQDTQAPSPEADTAQQQPAMPEGAAADPAGGGEADVEVVQEEPEVEVIEAEPEVEVEQAEPEVEVEQAEPQVEIVQEPADGQQPEMAQEPAEAEAPDAEMAEEPTGEVPEPVVTEMAPDELRGEWVIGTNVVSLEDETIGQIEDVIITPDGQISAAVLSVGGFLGLGAKNIAVDWSEFEILQDGQEVVLDLTREEAENAPEYAFRERAEMQMEDDAMAPAAPAIGTTPAPADGAMEPAEPQ